MSRALSIFISAFLVACQAEILPTGYQGQQAVKVSSITREPVTVTGQLKAFGVLESAEEINLNVDFSASIAQVLVNEGQRVAKGQPLLEFDKDRLSLAHEQTQHTLEQALAEQKNAHLKSDRLHTLVQRNTVSQQQFDDARFARDEADSRVKVLETQLQLLRRDLTNSLVLSPIEAIVSARKVEAGQFAISFQPLLTLEAVKSIKVSVFVSENHIVQLCVGNKATVNTVVGQFDSEVHSVSAKSDPATGNFEVKLALDNSKGKLKPGMTANVLLFTNSQSDQLLIPESALVAYQGRHVVYLEESNQARRVVVDIEPGFDNQLYVTSGLQAGVQLILHGARSVTEGSVLEVSHE